MKRKGTPKTGGRCKGTQNHISGEMRGFIKNLLENNQGQIIDDLKVIEPYQRLNVLTGLFKYCVPTMQSIETNLNIAELSNEQLDLLISELSNQINGGLNNEI